MELQPVNYHLNQTVGLNFYTMGEGNPFKTLNTNYLANKGFRSTSNDLMERNYFSIRNKKFIENTEHKYKDYTTIKSQSIPENDYLKPLNAFEVRRKFDLPTHLTNKETYNIAKEKMFAKDSSPIMHNGQNLSKENFNNTKQRFKTEGNKAIDPNPESSLKLRTLNDNKLVYKSRIKPKENTLPNIE